MFRYYLWLGLKSLRRNPLLTLLTVLILAIGIAASMTSLTVLYVMSSDPLPGRSDRLFVPQIDNGREDDRGGGGDPDPQLTWIDADHLLRDARGQRQTALYGLALAVTPLRPEMDPTFDNGMATTASFFEMFDVPLAAGRVWTADEDAQGADVAVITTEFARRLFGDEAAVGRTLRLQDRDYRVVGVIGDWQPLPKVYRMLGSSPAALPEPFWIPLRNAIAREFENNGWVNCSGSQEPGWENFLKAECNWLQYWVELAPADMAAYRDYLAAYTQDQRRQGRMKRSTDVRLLSLPQWTEARGLVAGDTRLQAGLSLAFFAACLVNVVGLMGAKYAGRAGEIGVRRALGASKRQVFWQVLVESGVIGGAGAMLGLLLSLGGLALTGQRSAELARVAQLDGPLLALTVVLSIVGALLAGLWPTWRAANVRPALQLKTQ
jgi:putative ABC transport system permease protein